jgi:hypothetical protein
MLTSSKLFKDRSIEEFRLFRQQRDVWIKAPRSTVKRNGSPTSSEKKKRLSAEEKLLSMLTPEQRKLCGL